VHRINAELDGVHDGVAMWGHSVSATLTTDSPLISRRFPPKKGRAMQRKDAGKINME
jgi:hypothetical protein